MEEDIKAKSLNRRKKLLQNREERMRKIIYSFKQDDSQDFSTSQFNQDFETCQITNEDLLNRSYHDTVTKEEDQLQCDLIESATQSYTVDSNFAPSAFEESEPTFTNSFTKKRTKSSSVILYSILLTLAGKSDVIFPIVVLFLTVLVGSYYEANFMVPFVTSQLVRAGFVGLKTNFSYNLILLLKAILNHLVIFVTLYVFINAIKYNK